jgi:hypothetical protein
LLERARGELGEADWLAGAHDCAAA